MASEGTRRDAAPTSDSPRLPTIDATESVHQLNNQMTIIRCHLDLLAVASTDEQVRLMVGQLRRLVDASGELLHSISCHLSPADISRPGAPSSDFRPPDHVTSPH